MRAAPCNSRRDGKVAAELARELRQQGIAAAKAGEKDQARHLLQQSIRLEPNSEAAWLWLASVARDQRERVFCLEKILEINPHNETALRALEGLGITPGQSAPAASAQRSSSAGQPSSLARETDMMNQEPGVPLPSAEGITEAQKQADVFLRQYMQPLPADVKWTHKTRRRAGEGDVVVLRLQITAAVIGFLIVLGIVGTFIVLTNDDLRSIVLAPTSTPTHTPTVTPTATPGFTPTPSVTPRVSPQPTATIEPEIPTANPYQPPQVTPVYPPVFEKPVLDAISAMNQGRFTVALPTLRAERALTENRFNPNPYYYEALAELATGDADTALDIMDEAESRLDEAPNDNFQPLVDTGFAQIYWQLAQDAFASGSSTTAADYLTEMQERAESAMEGDPRLDVPYILLSRRFVQYDDYDEAITILDQALELDQHKINVSLIIEKGSVYFQQGEYDLADNQAFLALYIDPTSEAAHQLRIRTALQRNTPGRAVLYAQDYLHYYPGSAAAYQMLGDARMAEGNVDDALIAYSQGLTGTSNANSVEMLLARAQIYGQQGRYDLAQDDLDDAFALTDDPRIQAQRMSAAYHAGRYQIALRDSEALDNSPVVPQAEIDLIRARALIDSDTEGDSAALQEALGLLVNLSSAEGYSAAMQSAAAEYTALAYLATGNEAAAMQAIDTALAAGDTGNRRFIRARILEAMGEEEDAIRDYEWVLAWSQVYPFPFRGDAEEALENLRSSQS